MQHCSKFRIRYFNAFTDVVSSIKNRQNLFRARIDRLALAFKHNGHGRASKHHHIYRTHVERPIGKSFTRIGQSIETHVAKRERDRKNTRNTFLSSNDTVKSHARLRPATQAEYMYIRVLYISIMCKGN